MQENKLFYFVLILIIIVGGYFLFFSGGDQATQPTDGSTSTPSVDQPSETDTTTSPTPSDQESDTQAETEDTSMEPEGGNNVVTYTSEGFSPSTLTVSVGEEVTFVNESGQDMWVASDIHPEHSQYPEGGGCIGSAFDSCEGIQPGGSWSFTFGEPGEWGLHNHLSPSDTGTIIVEQ